MKKVLYTASTAGHLTSFHLPWLAWLRGHGWTVHAAAAGSFVCSDVETYYDLPFTKSMFSPKNLAVAWRLAKLLRRERYDLVCVHTALAAFFTRLAVLLAGKKGTRVVNVVHGYLFDDDTPAGKRTLLLGAEKLTARVTDTIAVMNRQDLSIAKANRLCRGNVVLLPGIGLEASRFRPAAAEERQAARERFSLPEDAFVLLYAAEFSGRKHQEFLVRCLPQLPEDVWLLLPGRGELAGQVRILANQLGVGYRVVMPGFIPDVEACCHAADTAVSASRSEGLPFNLLEAMACGLPLVVSRVKGNEDLIPEARTGLGYAYDDAAAFCAAVQRLHDQPDSRERMGAAGRELVLTHYTLSQAEPVYTGLLDPEAARQEAPV